VGVTEAEDDVTQLSARKRQEDDVTLLSHRDPVPAPAPEEEDFTRFSPRTPSAAMPSLDTEPTDQTRISRRAPAESVAAHGRGGTTLSPLPPGAIGGAAAERGSFGLPAQEYEARAVPDAAAPARPVAVATPAAPPSVPDAAHVRGKREAARHRRLITAVIVVGATAAIMTAAILGIIALVTAN
jgi:hypothetical protein